MKSGTVVNDTGYSYLHATRVPLQEKKQPQGPGYSSHSFTLSEKCHDLLRSEWHRTDALPNQAVATFPSVRYHKRC